MGNAASLQGSGGAYLCKDELSKNQVKQICEDKGLKDRLWDQGPVQPIFDHICDKRGRITRLQLVWGCSNFDPDGTPKGYLRDQLKAMRDAARIANAAANIANDASAGSKVDVIIACYTVSGLQSEHDHPDLLCSLLSPPPVVLPPSLRFHSRLYGRKLFLQRSFLL
jgi:hypothetical protein